MSGSGDTLFAREIATASSPDMTAISVQLGLLGQNDSTTERLLRNTQVARYLRPPQVGPLAAGLSGFGTTDIDENERHRTWVPEETLGFVVGTIINRHDGKCDVKYKREDGNWMEVSVRIVHSNENVCRRQLANASVKTSTRRRSITARTWPH
ncbi:unnamed protein product [Sphagnum balticum]